jgi:hypothetical protein
MISVIKTNQGKLIKNTPIIFLAGPTSRKGEDIWRNECINLFTLHSHKDINLIVPEPFLGNYKEQVEFEHNYLTNSKVVLFWVPRDFSKEHYALTTNIEFGFFVSPFLEKRPNLVYGRPENSDKNQYLDYCYEKFYNKTPHINLLDLVKEAINILI